MVACAGSLNPVVSLRSILVPETTPRLMMPNLEIEKDVNMETMLESAMLLGKMKGGRSLCVIALE